MEKTQEENTKIYIQMSKKSIDNFIRNNDYKKAFNLLIIVLERLDNDEKIECIDYYSKQIFDLVGCGISHLEDKRFAYKI